MQSTEKIKKSLKREEAEVTKKPLCKRRIIVKKKIVTDKKEITEKVTIEELDSSNLSHDEKAIEIDE